MDINLYLEDWDNPEIPIYLWREQMEEAVEQYNSDYNTSHIPKKAVDDYKVWRRKKNLPDM